MGADYIPEQDLRASCWMKRFARELVADPLAYRTTEEHAAQVDAAVLTFRTALAISWPPATRSMTKVRAKNDARKAAELLIRSESQRIRTDPQISSELKVRIGLKPRAKRRRSIAPPESVPVLIVRSENSGAVTIRVSDSQRNGRAKPRGSVGMQLYQRIVPRELVSTLTKSDSTITEPRWQFVGVYGSTPIQINPKTNEPGDLICLAARWMTRRGETGAFGQIATTTSCFDGVRNDGMHNQRRMVA